MSTVQKMPAADTLSESSGDSVAQKTGSAVRDAFVTDASAVSTSTETRRDDDGASKPYVVNKAARKTKCRGPKNSCPHGNQIEKGTIRFGSRAEIDGRASVFWRHLECVTKRMLTGKGATPNTLENFIDFEVEGRGGDGSARMRITEDEARQTKDTFRALFDEQTAQSESSSSKTTAKKRKSYQAQLKPGNASKQQKKQPS